jgi:hypothetical protein
MLLKKWFSPVFLAGINYFFMHYWQGVGCGAKCTEIITGVKKRWLFFCIVPEKNGYKSASCRFIGLIPRLITIHEYRLIPVTY